MSDQKGSGLAIIAGLVLAVPFAIVPASVLLLAGSDEDENQTAQCAPGGGTQALQVTGDIPEVEGYSAQQLETAAAIMKVATDNDLPYEAQVIGIITAQQESTLGVNTVATGDGGDAGPFQQRTLAGWYGTEEQVNDVAYAATAFFLGHDITYAGPSSAGPAGYHLPGLVDIDGWESMAAGDAAQAVQGSDYPDAYAQHQADAERIISALAGVDVAPTDGSATTCGSGAATGDIAKALDAGRGLIGTPYEFGGGGENGPGPSGIDCSGFVQYVYASIGVTGLPRTAQGQYDYLASTPVEPSAIQPGDLIFYAKGRTGTVGSAGAISHVAIYAGDGQMIESTRYNGGTEPGVQEVTAKIEDGYGYVGIRRIPTEGE